MNGSNFSGFETNDEAKNVQETPVWVRGGGDRKTKLRRIV
jgi:hypothetical protein